MTIDEDGDENCFEISFIYDTLFICYLDFDLIVSSNLHSAICSVFSNLKTCQNFKNC